ncbi:PLP-dependent aminotransferase family protein [Kitasatospora sp. NPDC018058]|uniref:PLP-dependent aminotransferase family protein n=1 Tax=Kitasatospora sp. NPDC018058 TaxID=3364025 RepID=UPI0037BF7214
MHLPPPTPVSRLARIADNPIRDILALTASPEVISFAGGLPDAELFDHAGLRAAFEQVLTHEPARALQYSSTEGDPRLRAELARLLTGRGLPTTADELLVTTGSQQALALLAAALVDPGDVVLVEEPSYLAAIQCFRLAGARVVPVPGDDEGIDPTALDELARRHRPKFLYLVPTFQNPTGRTLTDERRHAVARIAAAIGLWLIEDDPYAELRYRGRPLSPLAGYPGAEDRTALVGSLSKTLAPGLRLGWLRAPAALRGAVIVAKQTSDVHTSTIDQTATAHYLATTDRESALAALRAAYRPRRDTMLAALPEILPPGSEWTDPDGGMFVWAKLPGGWDAHTLLRAAVHHGVAFVPGSPFYVDHPDPTALRLSFTTQPPHRITEGLARLGTALTREALSLR